MSMATWGELDDEDPFNVSLIQDEPMNTTPIAGTVIQHRREKEEGCGGYECEFVHPPPANIVTDCAICLLVLRFPHLSSCCGRNFCKECIECVQKAGKRCPLCINQTFTVTYNRDKDTSLKEFEVYCTHRRVGCEWRGKLETLDTHLNRFGTQLEGCAFVEVQCCNDGCGQYFQRQLIAEHQYRDCPLRAFSCEYCHKYESTYDNVTTKHWPICKCYPLPCPHKCRQETIQRQNLKQHLKEECPLQEVECEFKYAGCEAKLPRKDILDHLTKDNIQHTTLLARQNQKLMSKLMEKDEQLRQVVEENQRMKKTMEDNRREMEESIARVEEELRTRLADRDEQIGEQQAVTRRELGHLMHRQKATDASLKEFQESTAPASEVVALKNQLRDMARKQSTFNASLEKLHHCVHTAPIQIVMTNYEQHKRDNDRWYSDGFYTHPQGYKVCLGVDADGQGSVKGAYVSCYVYLMRGEFDEHVKWPFRGVFTIMLLNQREDDHHHSEFVNFNEQTPERNSTRVISRERAGYGWGISKFIAHSKLSSKSTGCQYLVNNCLYFQVKVELH